MYLKNKLLLIMINILNKIGKGYYFRKKILCSETILKRNFNEKQRFSFIQIGANDGISFDFLYDFVIKRNSSGIVVEPIKEYFEELVLNYKEFPSILKVNMAIHPTEKEVKIFKIAPKSKQKYPDWVKGIASLDRDHHKKTNILLEDIVVEYAKAETLMNVINTDYKNTTLDYLQIDTEGFDYEVLKMFDFTKFKPKIIKYESINLNESDNNSLTKSLKKHGYFLFKEFGDTIGIDLSKIKL